MTQIMPRREKRLKKVSKGCRSITQLFSLHQNSPESSTSVVPPVNEPTPGKQQNELEALQSESTILIDGDNTPKQTFEIKRQIESHETDVIQPKFHLPKTYVFTKTKIGSRERSFHTHRCEDYPWLHYNAEKDAAFCYVCMTSDKEKKYYKFSSYKGLRFIKTGFRNWKKVSKSFCRPCYF